jgi:hypothetical protein
MAGEFGSDPTHSILFENGLHWHRLFPNTLTPSRIVILLFSWTSSLSLACSAETAPLLNFENNLKNSSSHCVLSKSYFQHPPSFYPPPPPHLKHNLLQTAFSEVCHFPGTRKAQIVQQLLCLRSNYPTITHATALFQAGSDLAAHSAARGREVRRSDSAVLSCSAARFYWTELRCLFRTSL